MRICSGIRKIICKITTTGQVAGRKSLVVVDMLSSGEIREKFQVYMSLTEETLSVVEEQRLLKQQFLCQRQGTPGLLSNFARRRHVHHMSDFCHVTRSFLMVVKVGRFCMASALCTGGGGGLRIVRVAVLWYDLLELIDLAVIRSPLTEYVFSKSSAW